MIDIISQMVTIHKASSVLQYEYNKEALMKKDYFLRQDIWLYREMKIRK